MLQTEYGRMRFHLADVTKPLMSVDALVRRGHACVFAPDAEGGSYVKLSNGRRIALKHQGGAFTLEVDVDRDRGCAVELAPFDVEVEPPTEDFRRPAGAP